MPAGSWFFKVHKWGDDWWASWYTPGCTSPLTAPFRFSFTNNSPAKWDRWTTTYNGTLNPTPPPPDLIDHSGNHTSRPPGYGYLVHVPYMPWNPQYEHKMHFPQLPDQFGLDINFIEPVVLADDWKCSESGPVEDVHFWFSARQDWFDLTEEWKSQIHNIHLSIHSNIPDPDGPEGPLYSMPGDLLWEADFVPDSIYVYLTQHGFGEQGWLDPNSGEEIPFDHINIFQCDIIDIPDPFIQKRDSIYWLDITVHSPSPLGWKTSDRSLYPEPYTGSHYEDDAVWNNLPAGISWQDLKYPAWHQYAGQSIDMAFVITGSGGWDPGDGHKMHFPQLPDTFGMDVLFTEPKILADDWRCSGTGPVEDIHFWFSAYSDWLELEQDLRQQIFNVHVSIHANIPDPDGSGPEFSRPGVLLWDRNFPPDASEITFREYGRGVQGWFDPNNGEYIPDNHFQIYQCNIYNIPDPFIQEQDSIYWLDISIASEGPLGWKTADRFRYPPPYTGSHFEDDAVWGDLPYPILWNELRYPPGSQYVGESVDLAFVITGDTIETGIRNPGSTPGMYKLGQNFPNPFNPTTTIQYEVPAFVHVTIAIYNVAGERVRVLVNEEKGPGRHFASWNGRNEAGETVASGVYFYRMKAGPFVQAKKLVFLK